MHNPQSILVGVDFSEGAEAALRQAMRIAAWNQAPVKGVHVVEPLAVWDIFDGPGLLQAELTGSLIESARAQWLSLTARVPEAADIPFDLELDSPVAALSRGATEGGHRLLVLGTRGHTSGKGAGPVASGCVQRARTDVLLVQAPHTGAYTTVLACVDFSETSRRALDEAARFATQDGATLYVVHAYAAPWSRREMGAARFPPDLGERYKEMMLKRLRDFCAPLGAEMNYLKPSIHLIEHDTHGHGIGSFAAQIGADLIVLGKRGRTNLRDVLLGSTAERAIREAPCSVLGVQPPEKA